MTRTRGVTVRKFTAPNAAYAYALAEGPDGMTYVICSEGVGWAVTADRPLTVDTYNGGYDMPLAEVRHRADNGTDVDLAEFVRVFGSRLESNFYEWFRRLSPTDRPVINVPTMTTDEVRAIDAIWSAYLAMNAADRPLAYSPRHDGHADAMGLLADAARASLRILGFTARQARIVWAEMIDNGSGTEWNVDLLRKGIIGTHNRDGRI